MNKDKVYLGGYVVGHAADTLGYKGLQIQLENMDIVEIDENLVHKGINEPQEPVVLQFVADWYEEHKDDFEIALFQCIDHIPSVYDEGDLNEFEEWIIDGETKPFQTLVNMHQFGYTIEKEKRYIVKVKGAEEGYNYLNCRISLNEYFFSGESEPLDFRVKHTREMLEKADFGWVFDCPGVEIEEVEG